MRGSDRRPAGSSEIRASSLFGRVPAASSMIVSVCRKDGTKWVKASSFLDGRLPAEILDDPERVRGQRNAAVEQPAPLLPRLRVSISPPDDGDEDVGQVENRREEIRDVDSGLTRRGHDGADEILAGNAGDLGHLVECYLTPLGGVEPAPERHDPLNPSLDPGCETGEFHEPRSPASVTRE